VTPAGRPEIGAPINVRLGIGLLAKVEEYALAHGIPRSRAIRNLVQSGLRTEHDEWVTDET